MPRGATLFELTAVLGIIAIISGIAWPRTVAARDRMLVRGTITEFVTLCGIARHAAIARGGRANVELRLADGVILVRVGSDTLARRAPGADGVRLAVTGARTIVYTGTGLGYGLSNLRLIATRGRAADTAWVSRLGRVRRR